MAATNRLFKKILVANRGEIACRVMKTCKKMGIPSVAIHSEADARSLHVRMADEAVCVGPPVSAQSYLNMDSIMKAIEITGADAVHPGYGFLSENPTFVKKLEDANVTFIGPGTHAIEAMGDKIQSKLFAEKASVNTIPGDTSIVPDEEACLAAAHHAGYPVMVKASAGGGGKGMRIAYDDKECREAFRLSKQEALSSFGDDRLFVEKYIEDPRHIEIQILCDSHGNAVYLNERECSIQRRNQKVIEEAPSVVLDPETRAAMGEQACRLAKAVGYKSAGTTEFLVDKERNFYFLEMNTRLQVEHPVTEMTTGVDLVENMIRVAAGEKLSMTQNDIPVKGWAFESRVYAENPLKNFLPSIGRLRTYKEPRDFGAPGEVRIDTGIVEGSEISMYYDPMISKLVTHGETREEALEKMREALDTYVVRGVTHNIPFLKALCDHPRFIDGRITTKFIQEEYPDGFQPPALSEEENRALISTAVLVHCRERKRRESIAPGKDFGMYSDLVVTVDGEAHSVHVSNYAPHTGRATINFGSDGAEVLTEYTPGDFLIRTQYGAQQHITQLIAHGPNEYEFQWGPGAHKVEVRTPREEELHAHMPKSATLNLDAVLLSPMPGSVYSVKVKAGMKIEEGDEVGIIEAMKMQNILRAPASGVVKKVHVAKGDTVAADQLIYELE